MTIVLLTTRPSGKICEEVNLETNIFLDLNKLFKTIDFEIL